jgi:ABC-type glycerol-3-phosphate transport system substrate-binding protein
LIALLFVGGLIFILIRFLGGGQTTLVVWTLPGYEEALKNVGTVFSKSHKGVRLKIISVTQDEYETKALFALAASSENEKYPAPDIWLMPNEWMTLHRSKLVPAPDKSLDRAMSYKRTRKKGEAAPQFPTDGRTNTQVMEQDFAPAVATDAVVSNQVWGVPLTMDTLALYYDRSKVSNPPKTWQEVADFSKRGTERSGGTINRSAVALGDNNTIIHFADILSVLMLQSGANMVDDSTQTAEFNIPKDGVNAPGVQALDFYTSFSVSNRDTYAWNSSLGQSLDALRSGKTAMAFGYRNDASRFSNMSQIGVTTLPQINPASPKTYSRYLMATVTKQATLDPKKDNSAAAWDFVSLLANPDISESVAQTLNQAPARIDVAKRVSVGDRLKPFVEQVSQGITWRKKEANVADATLSEAIELVKKGQNASNAADVAAKKYTEFLRLDSGLVSDAKVLNVWQSEDDSIDYQKIFANYSEDPIQRVAVSKRSPDRYEWEALNAMAAGLGPDILFVRNSDMPRMAQTMNSLPDEILPNLKEGETALEALKRSFAPALATDAIIDHRLYGVPLHFETMVVAFNSSAFHKAVNDYNKTFSSEDFNLSEQEKLRINETPLLWDDYKDMIQKLIKKNGSTIERGVLALGTGSNVPQSADLYATVARQFGGQITDPDNKVTGIQLPVSSRETRVPGKQAEEFLKAFTDPASPFYTWNQSMPNALEALADGKVLGAFVYPRDLKKVLARNPNVEIKTTHFPQLDITLPSVDSASYYLMTIPRKAPKKEQALQFLGAELQSEDLGEDIISPLRSRDEITTKDRTNFGKSVQKSTAQSYYRGQYPIEFEKTLSDLMDNKVNLNQAAAQLNQLLRKKVLE